MFFITLGALKQVVGFGVLEYVCKKTQPRAPCTAAYVDHTSPLSQVHKGVPALDPDQWDRTFWAAPASRVL